LNTKVSWYVRQKKDYPTNEITEIKFLTFNEDFLKFSQLYKAEYFGSLFVSEDNYGKIAIVKGYFSNVLGQGKIHKHFTDFCAVRGWEFTGSTGDRSEVNLEWSNGDYDSLIIKVLATI
jgi:hypothetical protein